MFSTVQEVYTRKAVVGFLQKNITQSMKTWSIKLRPCSSSVLIPNRFTEDSLLWHAQFLVEQVESMLRLGIVTSIPSSWPTPWQRPDQAGRSHPGKKTSWKTSEHWAFREEGQGLSNAPSTQLAYQIFDTFFTNQIENDDKDKENAFKMPTVGIPCGSAG